MALMLTPLVFLLGHVAVPQELSLLSARHGWADGRPGWLHLLGLIPIGAGFSGLIWCLRLHFVGARGSLVLPWDMVDKSTSPLQRHFRLDVRQ
jgi:hypothetical protein